MNAFKMSDQKVFNQVEVDSAALKKLKNRDGETFEAWCLKHEAERRAYSAEIMTGYPPPHVAAASSQKWETMLAYAQEQAAVARVFRKRAVAVSRAVLAERGTKATESGAECRTWEQDEECERWEALVNTLTEWLWESRGREKALNFGMGTPLKK